MKNIVVDEPRVSIIVPAYNVEAFIKECIISLLNQTYKNLEIIIVDDGSSDDTSRICDGIRDSRIQVIHKDNEGLVSARKVGLANSKGKYVGFVDGDDYVESTFVEKLVKAISCSDADFVHASFCEVYEDKIREYDGKFRGEYVFDTDESRVNFLNEYVFSASSKLWISSSIWSKLFKREFINICYSMVPDHQSYGEDLICLICCLMKCNKLSVIENNDYRYRVRSSSLSHLNDRCLFYKELELCNVLKELFIVRENSKLEESLYSFIRHKITEVWNKTATYYYPDIDTLRNRRVIIYGAGRVGTDYYHQLKNICENVFIVDKKYSSFINMDVHSPSEINDNFVEYIVIATEKQEVAEEIKNNLIMNNNINKEKIVWMLPQKR